MCDSRPFSSERKIPWFLRFPAAVLESRGLSGLSTPWSACLAERSKCGLSAGFRGVNRERPDGLVKMMQEPGGTQDSLVGPSTYTCRCYHPFLLTLPLYHSPAVMKEFDQTRGKKVRSYCKHSESQVECRLRSGDLHVTQYDEAPGGLKAMGICTSSVLTNSYTQSSVRVCFLIPTNGPAAWSLATIYTSKRYDWRHSNVT